MARTSKVADKDIVDSIKSAKARKWSKQDAASSVNMNLAAYNSRVRGLRELLEKDGKTKMVEFIDSAFADGRKAVKRTAESTVNLFADIFSELDNAEDSTDVELEGETLDDVGQMEIVPAE